MGDQDTHGVGSLPPPLYFFLSFLLSFFSFFLSFFSFLLSFFLSLLVSFFLSFSHGRSPSVAKVRSQSTSGMSGLVAWSSGEDTSKRQLRQNKSACSNVFHHGYQLQDNRFLHLISVLSHLIMTLWPCGLMGKALVFGTKDCRLESCQGRFEPRAFHMRSGCDTTTPCALVLLTQMTQAQA